MDPLSVSASIAGLLTAAVTVGTVLSKIPRAPKFMQDARQEVADIKICLSQLQLFILGTRTAPQSRTALLMVEHVVVTLTGCVKTFAELEEALSDLKTDQLCSTAQRIKWAVKEPSVFKILLRLQSSKCSLNLLLTTLTCVTMEEARASSNDLHSLVTRALQRNTEMASRIAFLEQNHSLKPGTISTPSITLEKGSDESINGSDDDNSTITPLRSIEDPAMRVIDSGNEPFRYSFDEDLRRSRVYARTMRRFSASSLPSSKDKSIGWSFFSSTSLSDISNLSVIALPISPLDLWNGEHYITHESKLVIKVQTTTDAVSMDETKLRCSSNFEKRIGTRYKGSGVPLKLLISKPLMSFNTLGWDS